MKQPLEMQAAHLQLLTEVTNSFSFLKVTRFSICIGLKTKILLTIKSSDVILSLNSLNTLHLTREMLLMLLLLKKKKAKQQWRK